MWLLLPGAGTPREGEPQRFSCWSRWGSLCAWGLLLLLYCHSCSVPAAPVPCSSTWSSCAGQGAALAWGFQSHQCPLKSSVCFTPSASLLCHPRCQGTELWEGSIPSVPRAAGASSSAAGHQGLPLEPGLHRGLHTLPFSIQLHPTAGEFSWQGLESALGPEQVLSHRERLSFLR